MNDLLKGCCSLLLFAVTFSALAEDFTFKGTIGKYPIEMTISQVNWETGDVKGVYRYANKDSYLDLEGTVLGNCLFLSESYKGENTGDFYLTKEDDAIEGKWISGKTWFDVVLNTGVKGIKKLAIKPLSDYAKNCNLELTGGYAVEDYYMNDMWFKPENPTMEIGFSGGTAVIEKIHQDSVRFLIEVVCGPTYHMAYASGIASRISENSYQCLLDYSEEDSCVIQLDFKGKTVRATASESSFRCGFGARAYLDHEFTKITDQYQFEEEVSIRDLKNAGK